MSQLVVSLKNERKRDFLIELLRQLEFVDVVEELQLSKKEMDLLKRFRAAASDIALHQAGKKKLKTAKELLNEL